MAQLELVLLGAPRIVLDGAAITFDTRKAVALLAYLAATGQPQQRDTLATLLWPDADQPHARGALRRTLSVLQAGLHRTPLLQVEREQVALCLPGQQPPGFGAPAIFCDVSAYRSLVGGCPEHARNGPQPCSCAACLERLESAARLYRDDFMAGFSLRDSAGYDDWQFFQAEGLRRSFAHVLEMLVDSYAARHQWPQAIEHARRWLALDSLHEPAHRRLMQLYAWSNQHAAALRQYQECQRILDTELGVPPLAETHELYAAIISRQLLPPPAIQDTHPLQRSNTRSHMPERAAAPPFSAPLVGRTIEWDSLVGAYAGIAATERRQHNGSQGWPNDRQGHVVAIEGEPGVGKTTLAQAFLAHARGPGAMTAAAVCYAGEETLALAPIEGLLRQLLERPENRLRLAAAEPAWQRSLERLLPELHPAGTPQSSGKALGSQAHFFEGITHSLAALLQGPLPGVLLLDDVHHGDSATLDILAYIVRRLHTLPLLVIVTWCGSEVPAHHRLRQMAAEAARRQSITLLALAPFDEAGIAELIAAHDSGVEPPLGGSHSTLARRLYAETQGLPLFVVEYLDLLRTGTLDPLASEWPAPQGVRRFLQARMALLSETALQVLSTAAVIGRSFDLETVISASGRGEEETITAVEELLGRRLILEQGGDNFDFAHAQLRSLVYAEISQVRRRLLHRRVADALATRGRRSGTGSVTIAASLALHYELGGNGERAMQWAMTAGEQARQVCANREAITYFEKALDQATGSSDCAVPARAYDILSLIERRRHNLAAALEYAERSLAAANKLGDTAAEMAALNSLALVHAANGEDTRAIPLLQTALERSIRVGDRHREAALRNNLADLYHRTQQPDAAMQQLKQAVAIFAEVGLEAGPDNAAIWMLSEW